jgi:GT2 family glycosyltransferase
MQPTETNLLFAKKPIGTVAYIGQPIGFEQFHWSFTQLVQFCYEYACPPGMYVHTDRSLGSGQIVARNELVAKMQGEWLLQLDTDHDFEPDLALKMLQLFEANNLDVLVGLYCYKQKPHNPVIFQYNEAKQEYNNIIGWKAGPELKLLPVHAAGAGCLLVRRRVFDRLIKEFGGAMPFSQIPGSSYLYDDFNFAEKCRKLGIKIWCAPNIEAKHLGIESKGMRDYIAPDVGVWSQVDGLG